MTFGSNGTGNEDTLATSVNMEAFVRLSENAAAGGADMDSSQDSSLGLSRSSGLRNSLDPNVQPQRQHQEEHKGEGEETERSSSSSSSSGRALPPGSDVRQMQWDGGRPAGGAGAPLRRREAMSDLWQNQGAFRSNRKSMKDMFEEFGAELECAENESKAKAEVGDIFSYTTVGIKHLVRDAPSEDRVAIHPAVVPTIDEKDKEDLEIDTIDTTPFAMFGVFDGHGGPACAEFLTQSVSTVLAHSPVLYDEDLTPIQRRARATADSFEELEKVHNDWAHNSGDLSGSTAILSTFQDGVLVMAAVGDSAALYVDHMGKTHNLCPQHSTSNKREVERVLSMGGTIINNRVAGCLMPTRTIGDLDCKRELGGIVSPHPELQLAAVYAPPDDGEYHDEPFLVLASDGLWDVLSNAEVAFITRRALRTLRAQEKKEHQKEEKAAQKAAQKAASAAAKAAASASTNGTSPTGTEDTPADDADAAGGGGGGGGGEKKSRWKKLISSSRRSSRQLSSALGGGHADSFPGSGVLPRPDGIGPLDGGGKRAAKRPDGIGSMDMSKNGLMDGSKPKLMGGNMDGSRTAYGMDGSRVGYLDNSIRGLSASVRGGQGAAPIMAASLDSSLYAGLRAQEQQVRLMDDNLCEVQEGVPVTGDSSGFVIPAPASSAKAFKVECDDLPVGKELTVTSSEQAASVRSAGSAAQNVAMQLVHAALRAASHDDISVVVVTFTGTADKSAPGSRHLQRKGSIGSMRGLQR